MPLSHVMVGQKWTTQRELLEYWIRTEKMNDRGEPVCCNLDTGKLKPFNQLMTVSAVVSSAFEPVPPWLPALRAELGSQDNRSTSYPLFIVQEVSRHYGQDPHGEHRPSQWFSSCEQATYETAEELIVALEVQTLTKDERELVAQGVEDERLELRGFDYTRIQYTESWQFVSAHLTGKAAQAYIESNAHNLVRPRVYVTSQYRCPEWNSVRAWLAGTKEQG